MQITVKYYYVFSKSVKQAQKRPPPFTRKGTEGAFAVLRYGILWHRICMGVRAGAGRYRYGPPARQSRTPPLHHQFELIGDAELMAQVAVFAAVILHDALDGEEGMAFAHPQIPRLLIVGEHDLQ